MTKPRPTLQQRTTSAASNASAGGPVSFDGVKWLDGVAGYRQALREALPPARLARIVDHMAKRAEHGEQQAARGLVELMKVVASMPADTTTSATTLTVSFSTATAEQLEQIRKEHADG